MFKQPFCFNSLSSGKDRVSTKESTKFISHDKGRFPAASRAFAFESALPRTGHIWWMCSRAADAFCGYCFVRVNTFMINVIAALLKIRSDPEGMQKDPVIPRIHSTRSSRNGLMTSGGCVPGPRMCSGAIASVKDRVST